MNEIETRKKIVKLTRLLDKKKLSPIRSGNISVRCKKKNIEGFLITPSGKKNCSILKEDMVFVTLEGVFEKNKRPSSEWQFHLDLYRSKNINAIVHSHSKFAVICSCLYEKIPSFHYMIALSGGDNIKVAKYALYGSKKLSNNILKAIKDRKSCLISNHGQIALGDDLESAFELAEEIEIICELYYYCKLKKQPKIISKYEMKKVLGKVHNYKSK